MEPRGSRVPRRTAAFWGGSGGARFGGRTWALALRGAAILTLPLFSSLLSIGEWQRVREGGSVYHLSRCSAGRRTELLATIRNPELSRTRVQVTVERFNL